MGLKEKEMCNRAISYLKEWLKKDRCKCEGSYHVCGRTELEEFIIEFKKMVGTKRRRK